MQNKKVLSEFQSALLDATLDDFSDIPHEDDINIEMSANFLTNADALIANSKRQSLHTVNLTLKRLILIAAIISMLATTAMAIPAVREAIIDFFFTNHSDHYGITFDSNEASNAPNMIVDAYGPTYIPNGFELALEDVSQAGVAFWYVNEQDQWICFTQYVIPPDATDDSWFGVNAEETQRQSLLLDGYLVEEIQSRSVYFWFWTDNTYLYSLEITNGIPQEVTEQVFRSIQAMPN